MKRGSAVKVAGIALQHWSETDASFMRSEESLLLSYIGAEGVIVRIDDDKDMPFTVRFQADARMLFTDMRFRASELTEG